MQENEKKFLSRQEAQTALDVLLDNTCHGKAKYCVKIATLEKHLSITDSLITPFYQDEVMLFDFDTEEQFQALCVYRQIKTTSPNHLAIQTLAIVQRKRKNSVHVKDFLFFKETQLWDYDGAPKRIVLLHLEI